MSSSPLASFHAVTIVSGAVETVCVGVLAGLFVHSIIGLRKYQEEQRKKPGGGGPRLGLLKTPLPLLLRSLYLYCAGSVFFGDIILLTTNFMKVSPDVTQNDVGLSPREAHIARPCGARTVLVLCSLCAAPYSDGWTCVCVLPSDVEVRPVYQSDLDSFSRFCVFACKFCPSNYVLTKFACYIFFFIKQRTVRTMQPKMNWMEKSVLANTMGIWVFLAMVAWIVQADSSALDGTCQMSIKIYLTSFMAVADSGLSAAYLFLFLQPLRETIKANAHSMRGSAMEVVETPAAAVAVEHAPSPQATAVTTTSPHHLTIPGSPVAAPASPSGNVLSVSVAVAVAPSASTASARATSLALERVMRRNAQAAFWFACSACINMAFFVLSMTTNEPHLRKLQGAIAICDTVSMVASVGFVMNGGSNSSSSARVAPAQAQVYAVQQKETSSAPHAAPQSTHLHTRPASAEAPALEQGSPAALPHTPIEGLSSQPGGVLDA